MALYFLVPFVAVSLLLIFGAPEQIGGINMWIWIAVLIDTNILARKTSAKNYEEIREILEV